MNWSPEAIAAVFAALGSVAGSLLTVLLAKGGPLLMQFLNFHAKNAQVRAKMAAEGYERFIERLDEELASVKRELAQVRKDHTDCQVEQGKLKTQIAQQAEKIERLEIMHKSAAKR